MGQIQAYKTVYGRNTGQFDDDVNNLLQLGWELLSPPTVLPDGTMYQVLVTFKEEDTRGAWG